MQGAQEFPHVGNPERKQEMPIPDHLRNELGRYLIGQKLRALRLRRSMGLLQLGEKAGLSPALISKIENNKLVPTVPTLLRIALVFGITLDHFFQNEQTHHVISVTRKEESEQSFTSAPLSENGYQLTRLDLGSGDRKFRPYLAEYFSDDQSTAKPHMHQGVEFIHVLRGTLQLLLGADEHTLRAGDSIYFDSILRHSYRSVGEERCMALTVLAQPERDVTERRMDRLVGNHAIRRQGGAEDSLKTPLLQNATIKDHKQPNRSLRPS